MNRKRILFISNLFPNINTPNAASFSRQQINALHTLADIDVIAPIPWSTRLKTSIPTNYTNKGVNIYHPTYLYTPKILRALYGKFFLFSIRSAAERLLTTRDYDYIYASWLYPDGWAAAQLAKKFKLPLFINVVGTDANRLRPGNSTTKKALQAVDIARRVIAVSAKLKEQLVKIGADPLKIDVVYNGVDRKIFYPMPKQEIRAELGIPKGRSIVLFVGNLKKEKGVFELASAFTNLIQRCPNRDLELVILGSGPYRKDLKKLFHNYGVLEHIKFMGSRPLEEVAKWMNVCDIFCLPSYMEGQPNVIIEALACQTRIVATNVGGIPELDKGHGNLRLINSKSVTELTQALDEMLVKETPSIVSDFICSWQDNALKLFEIFRKEEA